MTDPIRVLLVDDHRLLADSLRLLLEAEEDMRMVGIANTAEEALERWRNERLDVVLMDIDLPGMDGIEATRRVRDLHPEAHVVVITASLDTAVIARAIDAGGSGFVPKTYAGEELVRAIRKAFAGEIVVPTGKLLNTLGRLHQFSEARSDVARLIGQLTTREFEALQLMASGLTTEEISNRMVISRATARTHIRSVLTKLGVHSRLEAVTMALREGLISPPGQA